MKTTQIHGKIVGIKRLNNSLAGNPQWLIRIYKIDETIELRTAANYGYVYQITESEYMDKWCYFQVSGTQRRAIVDITVKEPHE
jgi:mRNA-degrading endonuclease HigB of HigAB toxin-antitoxin module